MLKLTTDKHEASRVLCATAELLVMFPLQDVFFLLFFLFFLPVEVIFLISWLKFVAEFAAFCTLFFEVRFRLLGLTLIARTSLLRWPESDLA